MKLKVNLYKMCSIIVLLFMPLSVYSSIISNEVTLADVLLFFLMIICFIYIIKNRIPLNKYTNKYIFLFIMLILINTIVQIIISPDSFELGIFSLLRYLLYLVFVTFVPSLFANKDIFYKYYKIFGVAFAIYSIIQFLAFYIFGNILPNSVGFIPTALDYSYRYRMTRYLEGTLFRPYSVFVEPSYFSIFEAYLLFWLMNIKEKKNKADYLSIIIIIISMMISGSTGIICSIFTIIYFIIKNSKKNLSLILIAPIIVILTMLAFYNTSYGYRIINSIVSFDNNAISFGYSANGRIGNYEKLFKNVDNSKSFLFGKGIWTETEYLPSAGRLIVSLGVIGTILFIIIMIMMYIKIDKYKRYYLWIFFFSLFFTNSLFNITVVMVFSLLNVNNDKIYLKESNY